MSELQLLRPYWLLVLIPALLLWWGLWRASDHAASWRKIIDPHLLEHLLVGKQQQRHLRPIHMLLVMWLLVVIALAGPTWRKQPSPLADDEAGLLVLLKVSETMNATDVQPSRLERAKHKLHDLLQARKGVATGLIVYSGSAHLVMPLTRDDRIITAMIEDLTPELMPEDGDALAEALVLADRVFNRAAVPGSVLVMADAVSPSQLEAIANSNVSLPLQFLSIQTGEIETDAGIEAVASSMNAPVTRLALDQNDVERVAARARSRFRSTQQDKSGEYWQDAGYYLLPLIALLALLWARRGWVIQ